MPTEPSVTIDPALQQLIADFSTRANPSYHPEMDAEELTRILQLAEIAGIPVVVDGGWAVDALLGWQTRPHSDLDLAINQQYLPRFLNILKRLDYQYAPTADAWEHNFVLEDGSGHRIDLHSFVRNGMGQIVDGVQYPGDSLTGQGKIEGISLACIAPEWLIDFHLGYAFDHQDYQDVNFLANLFKLPLPVEYRDYADDLYHGAQPGVWQLPARFQVKLPQNESDYLDLINLLDKTEVEKLPFESKVRFQTMIEQSETGIEPSSFSREGLRAGFLLLELSKPIGALEVAALENPHASQTALWEIRQLTLREHPGQASLFMHLLRESVKAIKESTTSPVEILVSPLDDINQPRPALPERYDLGDIGFASFYARSGFKRAEPTPSSKWVFRN